MNIFRKKLSDDEYVESARNALRTRRWISVIQILIAIVLICLILPKILRFTFTFIGEASEHTQSMAWVGFVIGMFLGTILVIVTGQLISMIVNAIENIYGRRQDILLVKYYDALMTLKMKDKNVEQGDGD